MKKLTADRCQQQILRLKKYNSDGHMTLNEWEYLEAFKIALPILEQQDQEKSIIAGQLEAVRDSLSLTPHQDAIISCAIDRLNVLTLRTLELSRSLINQQERATNQNGEQ